MGVLKLVFFNVSNTILSAWYVIFYYFLNLSVLYYWNGLKFASTQFIFVFNSSLFFGLKFLVVIAFLILIRGGTPRYRYDYLTKLGWLKFIGLLILFFFVVLLTLYLY